MVTSSTSAYTGYHHLSVGEGPRRLSATVHPTGLVEVDEDTLELLRSPLAPEHISDLVELLQAAKEQADRGSEDWD